MKQIHCTDCHRLLCKANFADMEIVCGKCKKLVRVKIFTSKSLLLTSEENSDSIETEVRKP